MDVTVSSVKVQRSKNDWGFPDSCGMFVLRFVFEVLAELGGIASFRTGKCMWNDWESVE
jgi:hypothetical protein